MLIEQPGRMPYRQAAHMKIDIVVGEHESDALMLDQLLAEGMALAGMFDRDCVAARGLPEPARASASQS